MSSTPLQEEHSTYDTILILDFGSQYSHLITRRIRELHVYCELYPCTTKLSDLGFRPKGIILSGSPYSVYDQDAPHVDPALWKLGVPVLGVCYGLQEIAWSLGGQVSPCTHREYGQAQLHLTQEAKQHPLLQNVPENSTVWMSHGDQLAQVPPQFQILASTSTSPFTIVANTAEKIFGLQFHPEVTHSRDGLTILRNFVLSICEANATWTMASFVELEVAKLRATVGPTDHVVGAVSGGVDSTVAAVLLARALGDRFHAILVDNGLMRYREADEVQRRLQPYALDLQTVDASSLFLERLQGVTDPEAKRKIIGHTFIDVFEEHAQKLQATYLLQGTLYPDVIESTAFRGPSVTIKTHHNVGGLKEKMHLKLIEPLRELFKDEVRQLGATLGLDEVSLHRHPFPGPGLGIRILGEVTQEKVRMVQQADHIFITEMQQAGLYRRVAQAYAALLPVNSVGVMGDQRTYESMLLLRAVETTDFMTADWVDLPADFLKKVSSRIINEVKGINRVVYDISSKPPATIELE